MYNIKTNQYEQIEFAKTMQNKNLLICSLSVFIFYFF